MARPRTSPQPEVPGLAARRIAADILDGVLRRRIALDEQLSGKAAHPGLATLADRDRALMRRLVATVLRRLGTLRHLLAGFLEKGFPAEAPRTETILLIGAAQILWLDVPDHAAVDLSVRLAQADRRAARYAGLINAVLRRVAQSRDTALPAKVTRDTPEWLLKRWTKTYGADTARAIAAANGHEPALDLTVKQDAAVMGRAFARPRAADRHRAHDRAWRDLAAAGLSRRRLVGAGRRRLVAGAPARRRARAATSPICARRRAARPRSSRWPARASPRSIARTARLARLRDNLDRLSLQAETVTADALEWQPSRRRSTPFCSMRPAPRPAPSAAIPTCPGSRAKPISPCSRPCSSGCSTARSICSSPAPLWSIASARWNRRKASTRSRPCWRATPALPASRLRRDEVCGHAEFVTADGDLRTLPLHLPDPDPRWGGLDGFYAARLIRQAP